MLWLRRGGNVLTFVMEYENLTFPEAMEMLAQEAGIELPKQEMTAQQKQQESLRQTLLEINKKAARYYLHYSSRREESPAMII